MSMQRGIWPAYRDTLVGTGLLIFSGVYWIGAKAIRVSPLEGSVGAAGLPKALAIVLAILSLYLIGRNLLTVRGSARKPAAADTEPGRDAVAEGEDSHFTFRHHLRMLWMLAFGVGYLLILPELGYAISVAVLMAAVSYFLGLRSLPKVALFAVVGGAFFFVLFVLVLKIPLPEGVFSELFRR